MLAWAAASVGLAVGVAAPGREASPQGRTDSARDVEAVQRAPGEGGLSRVHWSAKPRSDSRFDLVARLADDGAVLGTGEPAAAQASARPALGFEPKVWAVFKANCTACHSADSAKGGLDLTSESSLAKGGVSGASVVPGSAEKSELVRRIQGLGGKPQMPLGFKPLDPRDIATIVDWIAGGAKAGEQTTHWAYRPIVKPNVPDTGSSDWPRTDLDRFVLSRLQREGIEPSPESDKETLLRRLSLDLTGLPPTWEEMEAYLADESPDAYPRQVERLLASPHYGERRALFWLDLARYADTNGYEADRTRSAWLYRDYVIEAFNQNIPFDQFTREQIAGDLVPGGGLRAKIATGFLRNSMFNEEGGVDPAEAHFTVLQDRTDTVAQVWLGSTLECARCHDHKYDPFTQDDYYRFLAYFSNTKFERRGDNAVGQEKWYEPNLAVPTPGQAAELAAAEGAAAKARAELGAAATGPEFETWRKRLQEERLVLAGSSWKPLDGLWQPQPDGVWKWVGPVPDTAVTQFAGMLTPGATGIVVEALPDSAFQGGGPGLSSGGNFIVTSLRLVVGGKPVSLESVSVSFTQTGYDPGLLAGGGSRDAWAIYPEAGRPHRMVITLAPGHPSGDAVLEIGQESKSWPMHLIGKIRVSATTTQRPGELAAQERLAGRGDEELRAAFRSSGALDALASADRASQARLQAARFAIPMAMVVEETDGNGPPKANVRERGAFLNVGKEVEAAPPAFLPEPRPEERASRLGLAHWLARRDNPLVARVYVNRLWAQFLGRGLAPSLGDLGTKGVPPAQPELLDYLAAKFSEDWDTKALVREIVLSATYRQSSKVRPDLAGRDPENDLLARMPRIRLEAEAIRDVVLAASGLLDPKLGGPSVFPYQPEGVWNGPYSGETWTRSPGSDSFRRGIYTFWKRTATYPAFELFDAPNRQSCAVGRQRSNTPLQALAMLNDPFVIEASTALAETAISSEDGEAARFERMFRLCTSRKPEPRETARGLALYRALQGTEAERWTLVANALLNLDETRSKP